MQQTAMQQTDVVHGGVCLVNDASEATLDHFCRIIASTLEENGHRVDTQRFVSPNQGSIASSQYFVIVSYDPAAKLSRNAVESGPRVVLCLCPVSPELVNSSDTEWLMAAMLFRLISVFGAQSVEWRSPRNILPVDGFINAFSTISDDRLFPAEITMAQQGVSHDRFGAIEDTMPRLADRVSQMVGQKTRFEKEGLIALSEEDALALAMRSDLPLEPDIDGQKGPDIMRLATWAMTGVTTTVSAPAGLAMAALNLARGEDFRLNTHVLSVGLLFAVYF